MGGEWAGGKYFVCVCVKIGKMGGKGVREGN